MPRVQQSEQSAVWRVSGLPPCCAVVDILTVWNSLYDQYSFSVIPLIGTILTGDRASYQYLVESIRKFPPQPEFAKMIADAGFTTGGMFEGKGGAWRDLWGGIASIHTGVKV